MPRRIVGRGAHRLFVVRLRGGDRLATQRLESRPPFDKRAMPADQCVGRHIRPGRLIAFDRRHEAIAAANDVLDEWCAVLLFAELPAQPRHALRDGVIVDKGLCPSRVGERILGNDLTGVRDEQEKQIDVQAAQRDAIASAHQATLRGIELERTKAEDVAVGAHPRVRRIMPGRVRFRGATVQKVCNSCPLIAETPRTVEKRSVQGSG